MTLGKFISLASSIFIRTAVVWGECPHPRLTAGGSVALGTGTALIVTHASKEYDPGLVSKRGIDYVVHEAKLRQIPIVYLHEPHPAKAANYFYGDCYPNHNVSSYSGEFDFPVSARHVVSAGGFIDQCKETTIKYVLNSWRSRGVRTDLRISEVIDASYQVYGFMTAQDSYYGTYVRNAQTTGIWNITPLDLMRLIPDGNVRYQYFHRYVSRLAA